MYLCFSLGVEFVLSMCRCLCVYLKLLLVLWLSWLIGRCSILLGSSGLLLCSSGLFRLGLVGFICFLCLLVGVLVVSSIVFFFICWVWDLVLLMWVMLIGWVCRNLGML